MTTAYLLIKCSRGSEKTIIERLQMTCGIKQCEEIVGAFDILARLESDSEEKIISDILRISDVQQITPLDCTSHVMEITA